MDDSGFSVPGSQDHLNDPVLLVAKLIVHLRRVFEIGRMGDYEARIDFAVFDLFQRRFGVGLDVGLAHLEREAFVHRGADGDLVAHSNIDPWNREDPVPPLRQHMIAWRSTCTLSVASIAAAFTFSRTASEAPWPAASQPTASMQLSGPRLVSETLRASSTELTRRSPHLCAIKYARPRPMTGLSETFRRSVFTTEHHIQTIAGVLIRLNFIVFRRRPCGHHSPMSSGSVLLNLQVSTVEVGGSVPAGRYFKKMRRTLDV
jgi:hypothetical protein